ARNRSPDPVALDFFGRIVPPMRTANHASPCKGIPKSKLQGSGTQSTKTLQSQNSLQEKIATPTQSLSRSSRTTKKREMEQASHHVRRPRQGSRSETRAACSMKLRASTLERPKGREYSEGAIRRSVPMNKRQTDERPSLVH